jgi:hypothetical protein
MALVGVTAPVRLTTLGVRLSFSLSSLARGHAQIERPPPPFCVGDAAPPDVLRTHCFCLVRASPLRG